MLNRGLASTAAFLLLGCVDPPAPPPIVDDRPLGECIAGWWHTTPGDCSIDPTCDPPENVGVGEACAGSDCGAYVVTGFLEEGRYAQAWVIESDAADRFCTLDVVSGTWSANTEDEITVALTTFEDDLTAECAGDSATLAGVERQRVVAANDMELLNARAAADTWDECDR